MQSVPEAAKERAVRNKMTLKYRGGMILVHPDGTANSWVASSSDTFAEDWIIVE